MSTRADIVQSFRDQAGWGERLGSPFQARLMNRAATALEQGGAIASLIGDWPGNPNADGLPLRFSGALHALVLAGDDRDLASVYPPHAADIDTVWRAVEAAMAARPRHFADYLAQAPQTNEVRRSALLLPGFVAIARETGLKLRLLEIGASAGLNQIWDRYRFRYGEKIWGDPASPVEMECEWRGALFDLGGPVPVVSRAACDRAPIDIADPAHRARLRAYIWPDQPERLARLDAALELALAADVRVEQADAADWLEAKLAEPAPGAITVMYHSVVWQYLLAETQARIGAFLDAAARNRPLAWLALEYVGPDYELRLAFWPGGGRKTRKILATTHPHGAWIDWQR
jgi:hypothetical protein